MSEMTLAEAGAEMQARLAASVGAVRNAALALKASPDDQGLAAELIGATEALAKACDTGRLRAALVRDMQSSGVLALESAHYRIQITEPSRTVQVNDPDAIPPRYLKPQPPALDRSKMAFDLRHGNEIPGAVLSNGGPAGLRLTPRKA